MIRALYLLFVLSGAAGLIYESIWTRYLGLFVGHDAYAQIIVLVIFLGGMSAGALAVSRRSERSRPAALRLRRRRVRGRPHRIVLPRGLPGRHLLDLRNGLSRTRRLVAAAAGQMGHRERADPAAVGAARNDLPPDVGRRAAAGQRKPGPLALDALLLQQPRRGGGRARRRFLPGLTGRPARHPAHRRHAQPRGRRSDGWSGRGSAECGDRCGASSSRKPGAAAVPHARPSRLLPPGTRDSSECSSGPASAPPSRRSSTRSTGSGCSPWSSAARRTRSS